MNIELVNNIDVSKLKYLGEMYYYTSEKSPYAYFFEYGNYYVVIEEQKNTIKSVYIRDIFNSKNVMFYMQKKTNGYFSIKDIKKFTDNIIIYLAYKTYVKYITITDINNLFKSYLRKEKIKKLL